MYVFNVCTRDGMCGQVACRHPLDLTRVLQVEGVDITQCTVKEVTSNMCWLTNSAPPTNMYTEKKPKPYSEVAPPTSLGDDLYKQHLSGKGCDLVLNVRGRRIPCHKVVLAARSKYFEAMFASAFSIESRQKEIQIEGFSYRMMDTIIKFMYTSEINLSLGAADHLKTLESILVAVDYFEMPSLMSYIEQQILEICTQNEFDTSMTHELQALVDIHDSAKARGLRNLQKIVATYMPMDEELRAMQLTASMQEDITSAFLLRYESQFYFGPNNDLHELLESGDLSSFNITDDIAKLQARGADAVAIHAGHTCVRRLCAKEATVQTSLPVMDVLIYFMHQCSYPVDSLDHVGQTMLLIAAVSRQVGLVRVLLHHGASTNASDAKGLPIARAVQVAFDRKAARYVYQCLFNRDGFADRFRADYNDMEAIHGLIPPYEHDWDSLSEKCLEACGIKLNEDFITMAARNYIANRPASSCFSDVRYSFRTKRPFSNAFLMSHLRNRFSHVMAFLEQRQNGATKVHITYAKQRIRECLIRDLTDWHLERRVKLCSLRHLMKHCVIPHSDSLMLSLNAGLLYCSDDGEYPFSIINVGPQPDQ